MAYTVKSSEKTKKSGAEGETKALLYLMNFRKDSNEIHYFVVDFFNDLTGMDRYSTKLWDVQSKAAKSNSAKAIGKELVTLYKNFVSNIDFESYILFLGGVSDSFRIDTTINSFGISNVTSASVNKLINGLKEESFQKNYIDNSDIDDKKISDFLDKVLFVIDDKPPSEYVKAIIKDHPCLMPEDRILSAIFNEIRDVQSSKKNSNVEGVVIQTTDEALNYCRHLTNNEIRLMVLNRIINRNPVEKSIPPSFVSIYSSWPPEKQKETLDECIQSLCRALFNKSAAAEFWTLFEAVYKQIINNPTKDVQEIYRDIDIDVKNGSPDFDAVSLKYFISVVKDGIQDEN